VTNKFEPTRIGLENDIIIENRGAVAIYRYNVITRTFNIHSFLCGYPVENTFFGKVIGFSDGGSGVTTLVIGAPGETVAQNFQIPPTSGGGTFSIFNYCYCTDSWDLTRKVIPSAGSIPAGINMFSGSISSSVTCLNVWVSNPYIVTSGGGIFDRRDIFLSGSGVGQ